MLNPCSVTYDYGLWSVKWLLQGHGPYICLLGPALAGPRTHCFMFQMPSVKANSPASQGCGGMAFLGMGWGLERVSSLFLVAAVAVVLHGCSQERQGFIPKAWHNLNSKYNAYFLASEKMKEAEAMVMSSHKDNYNRILDVVPVPSTATEQSLQPMLTECLKKASIPIQIHKNSDWVDDCYILVGKVRYYKKEEYDMAVYTFKYNFSKTKDPTMKQLSVIWLMRTYLKGNDMNGAFLADDYLKSQAMYRDNLKEYYVTKAWFHQKKNEYAEIAYYLEKAVDLMLLPTDEKARYHYIIAQIKQRLGDEKAAFAQYQKAINCFPPYEMDFYAKANIGQVTSIDKEKDVKKVNSYFRKLLKDEKNKEYLDKVYYEMGRFEQKQNNLPKALENWRLAAKNGGSNPNVKAYAYLRSGEVYYERLKQFDKAKLYYDSTLAILDTLEENYLAIKKRGKYLQEFIKHWEVVDREDSLQRIAAMDSVSRNKFIDKLIAKAEEKKKLEEKAAKAAEKEAKRAAAAAADAAGPGGTFDNRNGLGFNAGGNAPNSNGEWYFYNPGSVGAGRDAFKRKWGNRVLEDNWRRSKKEKQQQEDEARADSTKKAPGVVADAEKEKADAALADAKGKEAAGGGADAGGKGGKGGKADKGDKPLSQAEKRAPYLANLPLTNEKLEASHALLMPALFELGKVYDYRLGEYKNAETTFERLVAKYPDFEKRPEAMYYLYTLQSRMNNPERQKHWREQLLAQHPNSLYAKLLLNPNYLKELRASNRDVALLYKEAFEHYEGERYAEATATLDMIRNEIKEHDYQDKVDMLSALIIGKTVDYTTYKQKLEQFQKDHPKSSMKAYAADLIAKGDAFMAKLNRKDSGKAKADSAALAKGITPYSKYVEGAHIYVAVVKLGKIREVDAKQRFAQYNREFYPGQTFNVEDLLLGDDKHFIIRVREFPSKFAALNYLRKQQDVGAAFEDLADPDARQFVITPDNFRLLYRSKNIAEYMQFFAANYDMSEL